MIGGLNLKKLTSLLLVMAIVFTFAVTPVSAVNAGEDVENGLPDTDDEALQIIAAVDPYVRKSGNKLIVTLPTTLSRQLGPNVVSAIQNGLNDINTAVASGTLALTASGTIYDPNDEELVVQGGNVDKVTWHWWGIRRYASTSNASRLSLVAHNCSIALCTSGTVAAAFIPAAGPIGVAVSLFSYFNGAKFEMLANSINHYNALTTRGVIIDMRWLITYKVTSQ